MDRTLCTGDSPVQLHYTELLDECKKNSGTENLAVQNFVPRMCEKCNYSMASEGDVPMITRLPIAN